MAFCAAPVSHSVVVVEIVMSCCIALVSQLCGGGEADKGAPLEVNDHIPEKTLEEARRESLASTLIQ